MLRASLRTAAVGSLSAAILAAFSAENVVREIGEERRQAYVRTWARWLLDVLGVHLDVIDDRPQIAADGATPRLVVANHRSTLDILVMLDLFGGELLARKDMETWPLIGPLARRAGTLFVDRESPASGAAAVRRMRQRLRERATLCVFPEGTTFAGDEVRPFHRGAFVAIAREHGQVFPVGLAYRQPEAIFGDEPAMAHLTRIVHTRRFQVCAAIGAPRRADSLSTTALAEQLRADVQALVARARAHLRGSQ
jgi:1-acyl-sn-glycerol-3-phosphate acyltransferase